MVYAMSSADRELCRRPAGAAAAIAMTKLPWTVKPVYGCATFVVDHALISNILADS